MSDEAARQLLIAARRDKARPSLLLWEPFHVLRHTVSAAVHDAGMAHVVGVAALEGAAFHLQERRFDGAILSLDDGANRALKLIETLRSGGTACDRELPLAVITSSCDAEMVEHLGRLGVVRIIVKPFKVKLILDTIAQLIGSP